VSDETLKNVFNLVKTIVMFDLFSYYLSLLQEFKEKSRDRVGENWPWYNVKHFQQFWHREFLLHN
jgi:hypothetical protein